jgi:hypothetical protein
MSNEYKISDVLADESHPAHAAANSMMAKLKSGEINLCGCLGPMYGEPYCPCRMRSMGLEKQMEENPLRIAEEERSKAQWAKFMAEGGFASLSRSDE